jgi:hypothetical protein
MKTVNFKDFERALDQRKAEKGYVGKDFVRVNSGIFRTPEKKAVLRALERASKKGNKSDFITMYNDRKKNESV